MSSVAFESVRKVFGKTVALKDVDLLVRDGEFMVLLGPSGCGKTTLLRCLAGLERIDGGTVRIGERDVSDLPPRDRNIAMVFQSYAVFPHMKVYDNIAFGLRMRKKPKAEVERRVKEGAALLQPALSPQPCWRYYSSLLVATTAAMVPVNALLHPLTRPTARTMVSASTHSTPAARNVARITRMLISGGYLLLLSIHVRFARPIRIGDAPVRVDLDRESGAARPPVRVEDR